MPEDAALADECTADLVAFVRTDPIMRRALSQARAVFFGAPGDPPYARTQQQLDLAQARLLDWFIFDYRPGEGQTTPLNAYIRLKAASLPPDKRELLRDFQRSVYGVFEVVECRPGLGITLCDLADDALYMVRERTASAALSSGAYVLGRAIPSRQRYVLSAALSIWSHEARETIRSSYQRARAQTAGVRVSPIDMEKLFREAPLLAAPGEPTPPRAPTTPQPRPQPAGELPDLEHMVHLRTGAGAEPGPLDADDGLPSDADILAYAADAESPMAVLDKVQRHHRIATSDGFQTVMERVLSLWPRRGEARELTSFEPVVDVSMAAGPEERALMRQFAVSAQQQITFERYPSPAIARSELRTLYRRWLDTRQARLDYLTPREAIERERERRGRGPSSPSS